MPSQPSQSNEGPGRGRISRLDLHNFKSYGGKTTLGPFLDFSAVVGPNGAGAQRSRGLGPVQPHDAADFPQGLD